MSDLEVTKLQGCPLTHRHADVGAVRLHYVEAGHGPLVVLLHGFPEFWYSFRQQIPVLVRAGFRVVAPDLRGYNRSDKPTAVSAYRADVLADDIAGLLRACGESRADVVAHDWGAGVAWAFAMRHPARLRRLAVLNGPHPRSLLHGLAAPRQFIRSLYMLLFQLPLLPEALLRRDDHALLLAAFRQEARAGAFTEADLALYREAFAQPGALTAMLNYYRALRRPDLLPPLRRVDAPVLVLWGERDNYLGRDLARPDPADVPDARVVYLPTATHWVQHDAPERVNRELIEFLRPGQA